MVEDFETNLKKFDVLNVKESDYKTFKKSISTMNVEVFQDLITEAKKRIDIKFHDAFTSYLSKKFDFIFNY